MDRELIKGELAPHPANVLLWLVLAAIGAWLCVFVAPCVFLYMGLRQDDWSAAIACGMGCLLAGALMIHQACIS